VTREEQPDGHREVRPIDRDEMVGLATTEYARLLALFRALEPPSGRARPSATGGRPRHGRAPARRGRGERVAGRERPPGPAGSSAGSATTGAHWSTGSTRSRSPIVATCPGPSSSNGWRGRAPAVRGRRRTPPVAATGPGPGPLGGPITLGFLVDVIYTRDQWMHRVDIAEATDRPPVLTAAHDGRIVADIVRDWAHAHGDRSSWSSPVRPAATTARDAEVSAWRWTPWRSAGR
jgi:hypothetical protein